MSEYLVQWSIEIDADSPEEAATKALIIQRDNDPENSATVFKVYDDFGEEFVVDLAEVVSRSWWKFESDVISG